MIIVIDGINRHRYTRLLDEMYELRARVFGKRLGWDVEIEDGKEIDQFDKLDPAYVIGLNDDGRVVSNFVVQALAGDDVTVFGDGSQTRSFCYISDMVRGLMALMNAPDSVCDPVNLGNPTEFTILELAQTVIETLASPSRVVFSRLPVDDPRQRKPDISRAAERLGWAPQVPLAEGLAHSIPYFAAEAVRAPLRLVVAE